MPNTIALFASSRRHGNTGRLLDHIVDGLEIEVIDLGDKEISAYDYEHRNRDDEFEPLMTRIFEFEQIIFASPVYWYAVAPPMKIFLDRISDYLDLPDLLDDGRRLRGKTGFIVCTSDYDDAPPMFISAFEETFRYLGMDYGGCAHIKCAGGYDESSEKREIERFQQCLRSK